MIECECATTIRELKEKASKSETGLSFKDQTSSTVGVEADAGVAGLSSWQAKWQIQAASRPAGEANLPCSN